MMSAEKKHCKFEKTWALIRLATVFLFAGKLEAKKQPLELAEAFASLHSQAHLIYVGSGCSKTN